MKDFYQQFLAIFDKKTSKKLGIMYTPDEVVDFMLTQTNFLLNKYFGLNFNNSEVNVLDLFAGTGTFLARLLNRKDLIDDTNVAQAYHKRI